MSAPETSEAPAGGKSGVWEPTANELAAIESGASTLPEETKADTTTFVSELADEAVHTVAEGVFTSSSALGTMADETIPEATKDQSPASTAGTTEAETEADDGSSIKAETQAGARRTVTLMMRPKTVAMLQKREQMWRSQLSSFVESVLAGPLPPARSRSIVRSSGACKSGLSHRDVFPVQSRYVFRQGPVTTVLVRALGA